MILVSVYAVSISSYGETVETILKFQHVPLEEVTPKAIEHALRTPGVDQVRIVLEGEQDHMKED